MNHLSSAFPDPRGMRLHFQYWEESHKGYGGIALLLHGPGEHSGSYPLLVRALVGERYKVYALDFAGFGRSPGEPGEGGTLAMADAVEALCRRIEASEGRREIDIIAHSMGAVAALLFLKRYPARRARLVALAPLLFGSRSASATLPENLAADLDEAARRILADPSFLGGRKAAFFVGVPDPSVPLKLLEEAVEGLPLEDKRIVSFPRRRRDPLSSPAATRSVLTWLRETAAMDSSAASESDQS